MLVGTQDFCVCTKLLPRFEHFPISAGIFPFIYILSDRSIFFKDLLTSSQMFRGTSESNLFLWRSRVTSESNVPKRCGIVPVKKLPPASK